MTEQGVPPQEDSRALRQWQNRLLGFVTGSLVALAALFFAASLWHYGDLQRLRDECLNANQFMSIDDAREKIERWRRDYNVARPHSSLRKLTPYEFAQLGQ